MADRWRLYGARGWGSTLAEASLAWVGAPFDFVDVEGFDRPGEARDRLIAINPLARVPTLVSPQREVLTESAAIVLHLADLHPEAALAPTAGDPLRPGFLDRLIWFVSVVYPTFTYRDYPERWAPDAAEQLTERVDEFRRTLWTQLEDEVGEAEWMLGDRPTALDIYVTVMSHWRPRRRWISANCPKLHAIALRAEALPAIQPVMARNFPA
jgi:GST-like protein